MTSLRPPEPTLVVTSRDAARLRVLMRMDIAREQPDEIERLRQELDRAVIVSPHDVPRTVVTMHSRVVYVDDETGSQSEVQIVYPWACESRPGCVSVLDAVGTALLGLSIGAALRWALPDGRLMRLRVVDVPYQPAAAAHVAT